MPLSPLELLGVLGLQQVMRPPPKTQTCPQCVATVAVARYCSACGVLLEATAPR